MYIEGKFIEFGANLSEIYDIRKKVFIEEQGKSYDDEFDELDKKAMFCVVYETDENALEENKIKTAVATGRLVILEDGGYKIGRIAVLKQYRGKQYGDMIVRMLVNKAFQSGAPKVYVSAQIKAKEFYKKIGFIEFGESYLESGIEHIAMLLEKDKLCSKCSNLD